MCVLFNLNVFTITICGLALWSGVISASQFEHMDFLEGTGVKTSGAGEGRPFKQGEIG